MKKGLVLVCCFTVALLWSILSCNSNQPSTTKGALLAKQYCGSCHQVPTPDLLDKTTWLQHVLPKMGGLLGLRSLGSGGRYFAEANASLALEDWNEVVLYFYTNAPVQLPPPEYAYTIAPASSQFTVEEIEGTQSSPASTMVSIQQMEHTIMYGDGNTGMVYTTSNNKLVDSFYSGTGVSGLTKNGTSYFALSMGLLHPSDDRKGKLVAIDTIETRPIVVLDSLQRPVHASYFDVDGDGKEDIIICAFGNTTGSLSWYKKLDDGRYRQQVLRNLPGAVQTAVHDFNRDGKPDIIALMAQGDEGFFLYLNKGNGTFTEQRLLQFPPSFGSNSFQLFDFNTDGFVDIVATNGDNGDYPPILKPYHGIRVYLNNKSNHFSENLFLPVNGIGKAVVHDFDLDGNPDFASIAYFPDFDHNIQEGFVYWRNEGKNRFSPSSIQQVGMGRWLTLDAGDVDGDGDTDMVIGNASFTLGRVPLQLKEKWDANSPPVLLLRNNLKKSGLTP